MTSLDGFDLKILAALQDDGRLTNQQLADAVEVCGHFGIRRTVRAFADR